MKNHQNNKSKYYGSKKNEGLTYLEFGGINLKSSKKEIWDFKTDQEAYDLFMLSRYAKEIIGYKDGKKALKEKDFDLFLKIYKSEVHTKDFLNTVFILVALDFLKKKKYPLKFYELGFTLFGCIEALEACKEIVKTNLNLLDVSFSGKEISYLISELALELHNQYKVSYSLTRQEKNKNTGLFFAKGVSLLYAFKSAEELTNYLTPSKLSIFDYNFSLKKSHDDVLGTGKKVTYLSLEEIKKYSNKKGSKIFIRQSDMTYDKKHNRLRCYCIFGKENIVNDYLEEISKILLMLRNSYPKRFIDGILGGYLNDPIEDYIDLYNLDL